VIKKSFSNFNDFKTKFNDAGVKQFGSGWVWLAGKQGGDVQIISTPNQDNPISQGLFPIFGNDVWEHAYYLKYNNRRPEYLAACGTWSIGTRSINATKHLSRENSNQRWPPGKDKIYAPSTSEWVAPPLSRSLRQGGDFDFFSFNSKRTHAPDVLILGAGVAGLSAAIDLSRAGLHVQIIEGRERIGGRVFTRFDQNLNHAVELGAEFIHGLPPEIWLPLQERNIDVTEVEGDFCAPRTASLRQCGFFREVDQISARWTTGRPISHSWNFSPKDSGWGTRRGQATSHCLCKRIQRG